MSAFSSSFPPGLQLFGLYLGIMLSLAGVIASTWHWLNHWREGRGKPRIKVEPSLLVSIGLIGGAIFLGLAAVGHAWQTFWPPLKVDIFTQDVISPAVAATPLRPPFKFYSRAEKDRIGNALSEISDLMNNTGSLIVTRTQQAVQSWGNLNRPEEPLGFLEDVIKLTGAFHGAIYDDDKGILKRNQSYRDELEAVISQDRNNNKLTELQRQSALFLKAVKLIPRVKENPHELQDMMEVLSSLSGKLSQADTDFRVWMNECKVRDNALRLSLSLNEGHSDSEHPAQFDFAYALQLKSVDLIEFHGKHRETKAVETREARVALHLLNGTDRPLGYSIRRLVLDGAEQMNLSTRGGVIGARDSGIFYSERRHLDPARVDEMYTSNLELDISYGHPDSHSRLARKIMNLEFYPLSKRTHVFYEKESDEEL